MHLLVHTIIQSAQCLKSRASVNVHTKLQNGKICYVGDSDCGMAVSPRWASLSISIIADLLEFSCKTVPRLHTE